MAKHRSAASVALHGPLAFEAAPDQPAVGSALRDVAITIAFDLAPLAGEWRAFEAIADRTVFQRYDWLAKWQHHVGAAAGTEPAIVTGRTRGGDILFILPLAVERGRGGRRLTWLATPACDYNGPVLAPQFAARIGADGFAPLWRAILARLRGEAGLRFDFVDLSKMPEMIGEQPNPFLALPVRANPSRAHVATLGTSFDAWYAERRSGPTRKKERKQLRQLGEHGVVHFADVTESVALRDTMETLIAQKRHAFARAGIRNHLEDETYRAFYLDLATDPETRELAHLSRLDVGDVPAATGLGLCDRGIYHLVLSSYADGPLTRLGPGRAHLNELLRYATDGGFAAFDFTIGDEPYKRDYSDIMLTPRDHMAAVTLRGALAVGARLGFRRVKRFIKQTPALWRSYLKVRALSGRWSGRSAVVADAGEE